LLNVTFSLFSVIQIYLPYVIYTLRRFCWQR